MSENLGGELFAGLIIALSVIGSSELNRAYGGSREGTQVERTRNVEVLSYEGVS